MSINYGDWEYKFTIQLKENLNLYGARRLNKSKPNESTQQEAGSRGMPPLSRTCQQRTRAKKAKLHM